MAGRVEEHMEERLKELLQNTIDKGLYQVILSNPRHKDKAFKCKIRPVLVKDKLVFQETLYEGTKVFHENFDKPFLIGRIEKMLAEQFKQCEITHQTLKATILVSKKGRITLNVKKQTAQEEEQTCKPSLSHNRKKKYILAEDIKVPFLVDLGVQTKDGVIVRSRYDKFRQINRFLEFVEDVLPILPKDKTVRIIDFGCGKSYLTFAIYYYLHELRGYDVKITGLDLKDDVIEHCNALSEKYGYTNLKFLRGDIADYEQKGNVDMVVTLHACDTATDYALQKAVLWNARIILSVPCCQHEVNKQIQNEILQPVLKYGILKERMSALITDGIRANLLESKGYDTDILEFIDMEHTPKNLLIRAVKNDGKKEKMKQDAVEKTDTMTNFLNIETTLQKLL